MTTTFFPGGHLFLSVNLSVILTVYHWVLNDICFSYPSFWCDFLPFSFSRSATFSHNRHRLTLFGWIQIGKCWNCQIESCSMEYPCSCHHQNFAAMPYSRFGPSDCFLTTGFCTKYVRKNVEKVRYRSYWQNPSLLMYSLLDLNFRNFELWYGRDGE